MKFIASFTLFTILFLSFFIGLVVSVDPYDKIGNNPFGFETKAVAQSRENKFILLDNSKKAYGSFLLGSSAAHHFPTKVLKKLTGYDAFNYAAQHTTPEDYLAILRHIIDKKSPKVVVLQIGFAELDINYKTDNRLFNSSLLKYLRKAKKPDTIFDNNYFTLDAIRDSFRVIYVNKWGKALHRNYVENGDYKFEKLVPGPVKLQQYGYTGWKLSEDRVGVLTTIRELCLENDIKLIVLTAPLSIEHYKIARTNPGYKTYLETLVKVFGKVWNFHTESIAKYSTYKEFKNSNHMTEDFSGLLLERMFTGEPSDLGELIHN